MSRLLIPLIAFGLLASCTVEDKIPPRPSAADTTPKEPQVDPAFKPFPHDDPKVVTLPTGVKYLDVKDGVPHGKTVTGDQEVNVHYVGWVESGKRFDASYLRNPDQPTAFPLKKGSVIDGYRDGFQGMKEGGKRLIFIPWQQGYGETGNGPDIPPRSNLIFEVMLWEILRDLPATPAATPPGATPDDAVDRATPPPPPPPDKK